MAEWKSKVIKAEMEINGASLSIESGTLYLGGLEFIPGGVRELRDALTEALEIMTGEPAGLTDPGVKRVRVWEGSGQPKEPESRTVIRDKDGDLWEHWSDGLWHTRDLNARLWYDLLIYAPLTEVL